MSFDFGAFVAGAADTTLKAWETRDAAERKKEEMKMLEQLRRDTSDYEFTRGLDVEKKKVKESSYDPDKDEVVDRNAFGEVIGTRKDTGAREAYKQDQVKFNLDVANTQSQIRNRTEGTALERARLDESRADRAQRERHFNASKSSDSDSFTTGNASVDVGRSLFGANKIVVDAAIKDGIPAEILDRLSVEAVARARAKGGTSADAQRIFLDGISALRAGSSGAGEAKGWSLDTYESTKKWK